MTKKILRFSFVFIALLFIVAWGISFYYGDIVKGIVINEINKRLNVPATVGEIKFSAIRNFPQVSVILNDVLIKEKGFNNPDSLVHAERITFLFDLWQLFGKDYAIKRINVENSVIKLRTDKTGNNNYEILNRDTTVRGQSNAGFRLEAVFFYNVSVKYRNELKNIAFGTHITEGKFKGEFSKEQYDLSATADLDIEYFNTGSFRFLHRKSGKIAFVLRIDQARKNIIFNSAEMQLADLHVLVNGKITLTPEGFVTNLQISSPGSSPQALISLIPLKNTHRVNDYSYKGAVNFNMRIDGLVNKIKSPLVEIKFGADQVTVSPKNGTEPLRNLSFKGYFTNKKDKSVATTYLSFKQFKAVLKGRAIEGNIEITDFSDPYLQMNMNGSVDMALLIGFIQPEMVKEVSGEINAGFYFKGKPGKKNTYKASGSINFVHLNVLWKNHPQNLNDINGDMTFNGNDIEINNLIGKTGNSSFQIDGIISNFYSFIILPDQQVNMKVRLISDELDLDELLRKGNDVSAADTGKIYGSIDRINAEVNLEVHHLRYKKFESSEIKGVVSLQNKVISSSGLSFNSMEGNSIIKGFVNASRSDSILISAEASIKGIDITKLFDQMGNFGQQVIEDKNLKGKASAEIQFVSTWSADLVCNTNKVFTNADLVIENGELINFEPTQALSKYIKGVDFRNIKFSTLKNNVQIRNRTIYFSTMEIKSTAMDITTSGSHTFDNIVDYKIRLLLSQVLGKKVKEQNTEFGTIEDDGLGRTGIFLRMYGPMKNPKFAYDNKAVEDKIVRDIKVEKQELKSVLNKEFGWFKKDTVTGIKDDQRHKKEEIQIDYDEDTEEK